jgi:hypothetical protein
MHLADDASMGECKLPGEAVSIRVRLQMYLVDTIRPYVCHVLDENQSVCASNSRARAGELSIE